MNRFSILALVVLALAPSLRADLPLPAEVREFKQRLVEAAGANGDPRLRKALWVLEDAAFLPDVLEAARAVEPEPPPGPPIDEAKVLRVVSEWASDKFPRNPVPGSDGPFIGAELQVVQPAEVDGAPTRNFLEVRADLDWRCSTDGSDWRDSLRFWILIRTTDWTVADFERMEDHIPDSAAPPWR